MLFRSLPPCLPSHWPGAELTLVRNGRTLRFILVRVSTQAAQFTLPDDAPPGARMLQVGKCLRWVDLPDQACFVIALWAGAQANAQPLAPAQAPAAM